MPTFFPTARIYKHRTYELKVDEKTYPFSDNCANKNKPLDIWTLKKAKEICDGYSAELLDKGPIESLLESDQDMEHWYLSMIMLEGPYKNKIVFIPFEWLARFQKKCSCPVSILMTQGCVEKNEEIK